MPQCGNAGKCASCRAPELFNAKAAKPPSSMNHAILLYIIDAERDLTIHHKRSHDLKHGRSSVRDPQDLATTNLTILYIGILVSY